MASVLAMSQSSQAPEGSIGLGERETVGSFSHAPWQISSPPLALIVPPGTPDLAAADRTEERPIEKNNGMLAESRSLARSSAFAKSFSDGRFFKHPFLGGR